MTLTESVAKLATLVPVLKASDAKFASDLIASFKKYGGLTPKQEPWIGKLIARAEGPKVVVPVAAAVNVGGFAGVVALFGKAKESGLKFPKIRLMIAGTKVILSLNGPKSKAPGAVSISGEGTYPNRSYYGRVATDGTFTPAQATYGEFLTALTAILTELASNPARVAKDHGKLTGNCCFCGKAVGEGKEVRSVLAGFGPDCAEHYGLKAEWLAAAEKAEAKASVALTSTSEILTEVTMTDGIAPAVVEAINEQTAQDETLQAIEAHTAAKQAFNTDEAQAELGPDYFTVCFLCEQASITTKTLHGHPVCATCIAQLQ